MNAPMPLSELAERLCSPARSEELSIFSGIPCLVVELDGEPAPPMPMLPNCPVVAVADRHDVPELVDVVAATEADAAQVTDAIARCPIASLVLVRLLRYNERVDAAGRLFAESLAYSTLQHGAEFEAWLAGRQKRPSKTETETPAVLLERNDDELRITLNRPHKRNAYSSGLRDALCEALGLVAEDPSIRRAVLDGAGPCFSAGGDLGEFGEAADAGRAHASRTTRSAGALIHRLRDRVEARLHGACIGAGIELPAFAGHVVARPDAFFQLPEVGMGLIPGAGGTASILPRIGRHRLAFMALTGVRIDVSTALEWGLVDAVAP